MTAALNPFVEHYARFDALVDHMTALGDVWEHLGRSQQGDVLAFLLPGMTGLQQARCWDDLADPLERLQKLDAIDAVTVLQDRGDFNGQTMDRQSAYSRVRAEIENEIAATINCYRQARAA